MTKKPKKKLKKEEYVRVCPNCKSLKISRDKSALQQLGALPIMYICNQCGHSGYSFPEVEVSKLEEFEDEVDKTHSRNLKKDKTPLIDTAYGKFEVRFWWKIAGPILLVIGIIFLNYNLIGGSIVILLSLIMIYITYFKKRQLREN